ncbi:MAG: NAD(+)/NADH kinase, partial [Spirochaetota bacterium]
AIVRKMRLTIRHVLVIANTEKPHADALAEEVRIYLEEQGIDVVVFRYSGNAAQPTLKDYDLAISLGGDGTVLFSSRILSSRSIPILPVNLGDFGFITEVTQDEWKDAFEQYRSGVIEAERRLLVSVTHIRRGREIGKYIGLNDAVISSGGIAKIVRLSVRLSETFVARYRADGIIVATPTGSTAYSAAAGGPILHPGMEAMIINPICPFTLSHRPLVVPAEERIDIEIEEYQRTSLVLTVDGQAQIPVRPLDRIAVRASVERAQILRSEKRTFYDVLRSKLNWSGGPDA